jgi:hypothetical protein
VEAKAGVSTSLSYTPPLFYPGLALGGLGLLAAVWLLMKPANVTALLKSSRDERK